jgi:hypothetical protein
VQHFAQNAEMPTFLQPVTLPPRCFLREVLYWVAFQRIPIASFTIDGEEFRESQEIGGYEVELNDDEITDEEAQRVGINRDPRYVSLFEGGPSARDLSLIDERLARSDLDPDHRHFLEVDRKQALEFEKQLDAWWPEYQSVIEYPSSTIFVALKEGRLTAMGRLLPHVDKDEAFRLLETREQYITDLKPTEIPSSFWTLQGINFEASAAKNASAHYCHVSVTTEDLLAAFPGQAISTSAVKKIGDSYLLDESPRPVQTAPRRGRPSYPWEQFHIEAAQLVASNQLPPKKEAAIEHFRAWFEKHLGVRPSRAVIGEKLKPYYDRFVKARGQKI